VATPRFWVNARTQATGSIRAEIAGVEGNALPGFGIDDAAPAAGDSCWHALRWRGNPDPSRLANREIRLRLEATEATLYAIAAGSEDEVRRYWDFELPDCRPMDHHQP
jgi:hypothetical protein